MVSNGLNDNEQSSNVSKYLSSEECGADSSGINENVTRAFAASNASKDSSIPALSKGPGKDSHTVNSGESSIDSLVNSRLFLGSVQWSGMLPDPKSFRQFIEDLDLQHIIVSMPRNYLNLKPERARRKCMETLLETLESQYKVNLLILESREKHQNAKDLVLQKYLIKNKTIQKLQIEFKNGKDDARLWIPDQILGFYGEQLNKCEDPISVNLIQKFKNVHVKNI